MAILVIVFFLLGLGLSLAGGIIGIVQAFQSSAIWGLLYLFVPFASLVFIVKFWSRKWVRNSFFLSIGGAFAIVLGALFSPGLMEQTYGGAYDPDWDGRSLDSSTGFEDSGYEATAAGEFDYFQSAVNLAMEAAELTQTASTPDDWALVADIWQQSIMMLESVPEGDPNYAIAQAKVTEYGNNLAYAQNNSLQ